ncbi:MAG: ElyC/SanA/YdcF family protein [Acidobacteriota bacterium]
MNLEKIVSRLLFPVPVICGVLALGAILLWFTRRQKAGKVLVTIVAILLPLLANGQVSGVFLRTLEQRYHPVVLSSQPAAAGSEPYIVVLGSGYSPGPGIDLDSRLSEDGMVRLVEGVQLCRKLTGCKLILSGGPPAMAQTMGQIAHSLGIAQQQIILEEHSRNTEQEAQFIRPTVGTTPFLLVTSASHMPRAMDLFRTLGMKPIAAPTDYLAKPSVRLVPNDIYPDYYGLHEITRTVYEYLGIEWEKLLGQIK